MGQKIDENVQAYGAVVLLKHLDALKQEVEGVRQGKDIECVHRMRVASRRLRNAFELFSPFLPAKRVPAWESQARQVTHALGAARDTDVQIELLQKFYAGVSDELKTGIYRLIVRLNQRRDRQQVKVLASLDILETSQTLKEMGQRLALLAGPQSQIAGFAPSVYTHSFTTTNDRLEAFLSYESYVEKPQCIKELHAMRIAAKHLRYTLETFAPLYLDDMKEMIQVMRHVQDALGEIHDCDLWIATLPEFLEKERQRTEKYYGNTRAMKHIVPGIKYFLNDLQEDRVRRYEEFVAFWKTLQAQQTWTKLQGIIQIPVLTDLKGLVDIENTDKDVLPTMR